MDVSEGGFCPTDQAPAWVLITTCYLPILAALLVPFGLLALAWRAFNPKKPKDPAQTEPEEPKEEEGDAEEPKEEYKLKDMLGQTRCSALNVCWSFVIFILLAGAFFCFISPSRFYEADDADMPRTTCAAGDCTRTSSSPFNTIYSSVPWYDYGKHFKQFANNFDFSFHCKYHYWQTAPAPTDLFQSRCGIVSMDILVLWFSTLCAVPYFIVFTIFPGWAYKIHFKGGGKMNVPRMKCKIPLSCGKLAAAADEQNHQDDQLSRLLGLFIAAAFGAPLFFCRFGARGQEATDDALMMNLVMWTLVLLFHLSSIFNRAAPFCYSVYQLVFTAVICAVLFLSFPTAYKILGFEVDEEWDNQFHETVVA